jgi:YVTN family beta-propeller protein
VVDFLVLGPLEAVGPSGPVAIGGAKPRVLLAVLVLRAGEFVSRSELVDALWPEAPPASAQQSLESYVSRLRSALRDAGAGPEALVSMPRGYRLVRDGNRFDHELFIALSDRAGTALAGGDADGASDLATQALALWRGPALAGVAEERALRADAATLEDRRLTVIEIRAEADLAAGRDAQVIAELSAEASRHPTRERIQELLMMALYRSGRQTEALEVYRDCRERLSDELGLEPGPKLRELQARILNHDPSLGARDDTGNATVAPTVTRRRTGRRALFVGLVLVAAVAAGIVREAQHDAASPLDGRLRVAAIGELAVPSGRPQSAAALGAIPSDIVAGGGAEWATSYDEGTLTRIHASTSAVVQTILVGDGASGVAIDAGDAWVAESLTDRLARVSIATNRVVQRIPVGQDPVGVAAGAGSIWVANVAGGTVTRIDPLTGGVLGATKVGSSPVAVAVGDGAVWVALQGSDSVAQLDAQTGQVVRTISVGSGPSAIAIGSSGVWVANQLDSTVSLIDPSSDSVVLTRAVTGSPGALAAVGGDVWIAGDEPELSTLTPSGRSHVIAIPSPATALATGAGGVLVGVRGIGADHRGGTLIARMAGGGPIDQIDPASCCDLPPDVRPLAYDSLLSFSKSPASPDTLVPDLALAIPSAEDGGLVYTFRLRPGLRYWTGAPVRASDFVRGLEQAAQSSDQEAPYISALAGALDCPGARQCNLTRDVIANDRAGTVTLHLSHPDPEILLAMGLPYFAPKPPGGGVRPGTGPYRIVRYVPGVLVDFERNPFFREWAPAAQPAGYPNRILVYSNGTATADIDAVLAGRADYTFDQPTPGQLRTILLQYPGLLHTEPLPDTDWISLNTHEPPFNNVLARQALNYAIDRRAITNLYGGPEDATPTCQVIPPTVPGYQPYCPYTRDPSASGHWTAPNLEHARGLIAASGTRGDTVTILTAGAADGPGYQAVGAYTVGLLHKLGYRARLRVVAPARFIAVLDNYHAPPQVDTQTWTADYPSASQWLTLQLGCGAWHPPTEVSNHSEFCNPTVDRLAERATELQATNPTVAKRLWAQADRLTTNLAPVVATVTENETDLVSRRVGDYQYVPTIGALLDQLWVR